MWMEHVEESGYFHYLWYLAVRPAKAMVVSSLCLDEAKKIFRKHMTLTKDETYLLTQTWCPKAFLGLMKFLAWVIHKRHDDDEFKLGDLLIKHIYIPPTILLSAETN